ncbi:YdcF family protein [Rhodococcus pyridinivorans]|nr:YdcF family protein [Rhodococcus pyridinivorans]
MEEIPNDPCGTRYPELPIVVTGGVPRNDITEARAMKDWLVVRGIPPERITEETRSTSTVENARLRTRSWWNAARRARCW